MSPAIDLNSDLGEGFGRWELGDDEAMLDLVTSANVACGFHAGDPGILRRVCAGAAARGVAIGAQVGYRDLVGFGRRHLEMEPEELADEVIYQVGALDALARVEGTRVAYVKPHGALYNDAASDAATADAVARAIAALDAGLPLVGLAGSELVAAAERCGLTPVAEAFADRGYTAYGMLVPRREPGAIISDPLAVARRCVQLVTEGTTEAVDGSTISIAAQSICVHGDTPRAVEIATAVRAGLVEAGVTIRSFVGSPGA